MPRRRAPRLTGQTRPQVGWQKAPKPSSLSAATGRMAQRGLHWTTGSVVNSVLSFEEMLDRLRVLWKDHANVGALRDAMRLCATWADPPQPMPTWVVESIDATFMSSDWAERWAEYEADMRDVARLDRFEIARAHGLSRPEAAQFAIDVDVAAGLPVISVAKFFKTIEQVPKRAAANPGRYYHAHCLPIIDTSHWTEALQAGQRRLDERTGGDRLFVSTAARVKTKHL